MARVAAIDFAENTYALSIGVGHFSDRTFQTLPAAEPEAQEFGLALRNPTGCAVPAEHIKILAGEAATRAAIISGLTTIVSDTPPGCLLLIYFSGHAFREGGEIYLCGVDATKTDLRTTAVAASAVADSLSDSKSRGILLILDCCVSAGFAEHAPSFFLHTQGSEFRILFAASREDQPSWELANGEGTLFSKHLINIVKGVTAVGSRPGQITLGDLVEGIDFHLNEDLKARYPNVPAQEPIVAGSFGRDPLLLVHRHNTLAGLSLETERVSRSLHRRIVRRLIVGAMVAIVFSAFTYLSWLDKHLYAQADANLVRIYRGYPGWGAPGFPQLVWERPISAAALSVDSPLRKGGSVVAPMGRPIKPVLNAQLNEVGEAAILMSEDKHAEARNLVLRVLDTPGEPPDTAHFGRILLADVGTIDDLPRLRSLLTSVRPEIRTNVIRRMMKISPEEAFSTLSSALSDQERFDQRSLINEISYPCPKGASQYFDAAARSAEFNGAYRQLTDSAVRAGCTISASAVAEMSRFWPVYELENLSRYQQLLDGGGSTVNSGEHDPVRQAFFDSGQRCPLHLAEELARNQTGPVGQHNSILLLLSPSCEASGETRLALENEGNLSLSSTDQQVSLKISPTIEPGIGIVIVRRLGSRSDPSSLAFLKEIAQANPDSLMKAMAIEALRKRNSPVHPSPEMLTSGNLPLRRASYQSLALLDHEKAFESLRGRVNDQDLVDWPDLMYVVSPNAMQLDELHPFLKGGALEKQRCAAVFAEFGTEADIHMLARDPAYDVRQSVAHYISANRRLGEFHPIASTNEYDDFATIVSVAYKKRFEIEREITAVPDGLRNWRTNEILGSRQNAFDTSFRQVLDPGMKLWLEVLAEEQTAKSDTSSKSSQ